MMLKTDTCLLLRWGGKERGCVVKYCTSTWYGVRASYHCFVVEVCRPLRGYAAARNTFRVSRSKKTMSTSTSGVALRREKRGPYIGSLALDLYLRPTIVGSHLSCHFEPSIIWCSQYLDYLVFCTKLSSIKIVFGASAILLSKSPPTLSTTNMVHVILQRLYSSLTR